MPTLEYIDAESCLFERIEVELEVALSLKHTREMWLACGYVHTELRTIGWPEEDGGLIVQVVPVSILNGRSLA